MEKIGIIGLGLMGGSLALAIHKYTQLTVIGYDKNSDNLTYSLEKKIIDYELSYDNIKDIDYLFIAVPVRSIHKVIKKYYHVISSSGITVTDMGSTKSYLNNIIKQSFPDLKYIGGHPVAGKEKSGPQSAEAELFSNKNYILINNNKHKFKKEFKQLKNILKKIGCNVISINLQEHDRILAFSSHLPQVLSTSLMLDLINIEEEHPDIKKFTGSGFNDMTRLAASDPDMWVDILLTNKSNIISRIDQFIDGLNSFKDVINSGDEQNIYYLMNKARRKRKEV